jgi:hypothetical protein
MALTAETIVLRAPDKLSSLNDIWGNTIALGLSTSDSSIIGVGSNNFRYFTLLTAFGNGSETNLGVFQYPPRPTDNSGFLVGYGAFSVSNPLRSFISNTYQGYNTDLPIFLFPTSAPNFSSPLIKYSVNSGFSYNPNLAVTAFQAVVGPNSFLGFSFSTVSPFDNNVNNSVYIVSDNTFVQGVHALSANGTTNSVITTTPFTSSMASATPLGTITEYSQSDYNTTNITDLYGFNGVIPYELYPLTYNWLVINGSTANYPLDNPPTTFKFLSNYPNRSQILCTGTGSPSCFNYTKKTRVGYYETIDCIIDTGLFATNSVAVIFRSYDKNYAVLDNFVESLNATLSPTTPGDLYKVRIPVGWLNRLAYFITPDDVEYLSVHIVATSSSTILSEYRYYKYDRECTIYDPVEFMFLNKLGGWDYWTFTQDNKETRSITRNEYKKEINWGETQNGSLGIGFRGRTVMSGNIQKTFTANTNWISETEYEFLSELVESPEVYIMKYYATSGSAFDPVAVVITDTSYEIKTAVRDSIFNLTINYKMAVDTPMQRQ